MEVALQEAGIRARARVDGREVTVLGTVADRATSDRIERLLGDVWGVRSLHNGLEIDGSAPPPVAAAAPVSIPFRVAFARTAGGVLTLSGDAPAGDARRRWLEQVGTLFPECRVEDRMVTRSGGPGEAFESAVAEGLRALAELDEGRVSVGSAKVWIGGSLANGTSETDFRARLESALPHPYSAAFDFDSDHRVPAAESVARAVVARTRDDRIVLRGVAPGAVARDQWVREAVELYGEQRVEGDLQLARGEVGDEYGACLLVGLRWVGEIFSGRIEVTPSVIRVAGQTSAEQATRLERDLQAAGCRVDLAALARPEVARR